MTIDSATQELLHLREKSRPQALLPDDERIAIIQEGSWINLATPKSVIDKLQAMLDAPRVTKPPCLLLIGNPDSGKSSIFERFLSLHSPDSDPESSVARSPVVSINCPDGRDRSALYVRILTALFASFKPAEKPEVLRAQVIRLFRDLQVRMLLIDELHDALGGTVAEQNSLRTAIKDLTNVTKVNIAAAGIQTARTFFAVDTQMTSRFRHTIELPIWKANEELGQLLATLEQRFPLRKPSGLKEPAMLTEILRRSEGNLGDICNLVQEAAISAINDPKKPEMIDVARIRNLVWTSPSSRKNFQKYSVKTT
jgi:Bacterial TniB protein